MTPELLDAVLDKVLGAEGGIANHENDRGGLTSHGLTRPFLETVTARKWSDEDIRSLTPKRAREIYRLWTRIRRLDQLPEDFVLAWVVIDFAVITTERRAIRALQQFMGITQDGIAGAETQGNWHRLSEGERRKAAAHVIAARMVHHGQDVKLNRKQGDFIHGWMVRLAEQVKAVAA